MTEEELKQKAKLFIISHKQNKFMFDISLVDLLTLFATKITKELEQELEHKRIAIKTRKARIKDLEKENAELKKELSENKVADCHIVNGLCEQLTKAKKLLKQFLEAKNGEDTYKAEWEAEQFLKEIEK